MDRPQRERREKLETLLGTVEAPVYLTPMTRDRTVAAAGYDRRRKQRDAGMDDCGHVVDFFSQQPKPLPAAYFTLGSPSPANAVVTVDV